MYLFSQKLPCLALKVDITSILKFNWNENGCVAEQVDDRGMKNCLGEVEMRDFGKQ